MFRNIINGIYIGIPNHEIYTNAEYQDLPIKNYYVGKDMVHTYNTNYKTNDDYSTLISLTLTPKSDASFISAIELQKYTKNAISKHEHGLRLNKY